MRRALTILALVLVLVGVGVAAYYYFFPSTATLTTAPGAPTNTNLPGAGQTTLPGDEPSSGVTAPATLTMAPTVISPRLVQISVGPVVPGMAVTRKSGDASTSPEVLVHYIERQSGNAYAYSSLSKTTTRTSNKTLPGIQSATWLPDASKAFVQYLSGDDFSTVNTYALPATGASGFFLAQNLADLRVSATNILTLASGVNGSVASLARTDGTRTSQAFTTPLSSLRISFAGKQYLAFTKPSATLPGSAFIVDSAGRFSRVAGPKDGLVALASPSGKWLLVSYTLGSSLQMELVNVATGEALQLPVATIADKCVWTDTDASLYCGIPINPRAGSYPDDWYQGVTHFSDRIWKIDVASRYAQLVLDFNKETDSALDAEALAVDSANTTLVFVNKNDGSLWSYSL